MSPRPAHSSLASHRSEIILSQVVVQEPLRREPSPITSPTDMALLTEGGAVPLGVYKHSPPNGGRPLHPVQYSASLLLDPTLGMHSQASKVPNRAKHHAE